MCTMQLTQEYLLFYIIKNEEISIWVFVLIAGFLVLMRNAIYKKDLGICTH